MNKYNISVLAEAKEEYTRQLINIISPHIYVGIKSIYDTAASFCRRTNDKNVLKKFQLLLATIPDWNQSKINDEYKRICKDSECDWVEDLITAVFVSHTKVLSSIKIKKKSKPIELNVPDGPYFIHKCYLEVARNFWKKPYLLHTDFPNLEIQRNLSDSENVIKESVIECIRKLLPVKYILKEYLGNNFEDEDDDITSDVSVNTKSNLRKLVKQEIEQSLSKDANSDTDKVENFSRVEVDDDENTKTDTEVKEVMVDDEVSSEKQQTSKEENPVDETPEETNTSDVDIETKSKESVAQEETILEKPVETQALETDKDSRVKLTLEESDEKEVVGEKPDMDSDQVEENTKLIRLDEAKIDEPRVDEPRVDEPRVDEPRVDEPNVELEEKINDSVEVIDLGSNNNSLDDIIEKENNELNKNDKVSEENKDVNREEQKPLSDNESIENINKIRDTIKETISKNNKEDNDADFSFFEDAAPF